MQLTDENLPRLIQALRDAYREECKEGDCDCVTREEHERSLAGKGR